MDRRVTSPAPAQSGTTPTSSNSCKSTASSAAPRCRKTQRKKRVTLYLDPDVLARLKADGKGWQTRANAALRKALGL